MPPNLASTRQLWVLNRAGSLKLVEPGTGKQIKHADADLAIKAGMAKAEQERVGSQDVGLQRA